MIFATAVLQLEGLGVREEVVHLARRVLERQLHVVQPGRLQRRGALCGEADARGEQVGVVAQPVRLGDDQLEVVAQQRLAAGQAALHGAEFAPFAQHAHPVFGGQFVGLRREVDRVVAEHAVQRAAVGELGQQPQRRAGPRGAGTHRLMSQPASAAWPPSRRRRARRRAALHAERLLEVGDDVGHAALPSQRFMISPALLVELDHALG
jgi:hypothetical protein